ncbi:unnamed protein product [Symbiodinium sp. CCMP2456]|nr:unnamed protein product [Symbiodinium sp. CCMP2456]
MPFGRYLVVLTFFLQVGCFFRGISGSPESQETADKGTLCPQGLALFQQALRQGGSASSLRRAGETSQCQHLASEGPAQIIRGSDVWVGQERMVVRNVPPSKQAGLTLLPGVWTGMGVMDAYLYDLGARHDMEWVVGQGASLTAQKAAALASPAAFNRGEQGQTQGQSWQACPASKGGQRQGDPSVDGLPSAPSTPMVTMPRKAQQEAVPAQERTQLDALLGILKNSAVSLPEEAQSILAELHQNSSQSAAKVLHRAVADQAKSRQALAKVQAQRQNYMAAWKDYLGQIYALLEQQVEEQNKVLLGFDEAEAQWASMEHQATQQLAKLANADKDGAEGSEKDAEMNEQLVTETIDVEARLADSTEANIQDGQKLLAALRSMKDSADQTKPGRDGSRTPRKTGTAVDLTQGEGKDAEAVPKAGLAVSSGQPQPPPAKQAPPGGARS